jgi:hypothetical protein
MLADTVLLLKLYWTIDRRADRGRRRGSRLVIIIGSFFLIVVSGALGFFAASLVDSAGPLQIRSEVLPGLLFTVVLFGVVFLGFSQALQALYLSDDLDKLLVAPIRSQAVMTAKLLSRMPSMLSFLLLATIPALITFGIGVGLNLFYFILGLLLILVTPLFGISLGALVAIFMVRLLPARRLNEWVGAASIVIGVLISLIFYIPAMMRQGNEQALDEQTLATVQTFINQLGDLPLPSTWVGAALVEIGRGQIAVAAIGSVLLYLLITVGFFLVTIFLANRLYLTGWLRMQSAGAVAQEIDERPGVFGRNSLDFILAYKDWLLRIRDPRLLATLFSSVIFALVAIFFMLRPNEDGSSLLNPIEGSTGDGVAPFSTGIVICGILYFLGWMLFQRMALTALSIERQAFYVLKVAPISASQVLRAKVFGLFLPYAIISSAGLVAAMFILDLNLIWVPYGLLVLLIMGYGLFSYLTAVGFLYPNLTWDDPRRMANRKAGLPSLIGSFAYSLVCIVIAWLIYMSANANSHVAVPIVIMGLAVLGAVTWFFVHWSSRRVEKAWSAIGAD